ncbi:hypothetical protein N7333_07835 [Pseudomonas sp. GD04158]|jgi:hypothetical protein|uniref:hypothetical protein n=1 Tax=Pseudomonas sp. GD04158 TaxID=2975439 RepID=UPI00244A466D|nr:hypothetical protein [Pseudomonas sp. GD04158]MDH0096486.1 hypothetical protein [Pseudomonas sp. GD04158]
MNRMVFAACCGLLLVAAAQADDCRQQLPAWIEQAHPGHATGQVLQDERGRYRVDVEQSICKVWPARPGLTLIAMPLVRAEHDSHGEADLEVLVLDNARQTFLARLIEPNQLDWDAIYVDRLALDTAPYRLRGDDLAFGVRISRRNGSRMNPFAEAELTLYELQEQGLRSLMGALVVESFGGERDDDCIASFGEAKGVLIVTGKVGRDGYRDLLFKRTHTGRRMVTVDAECRTLEDEPRSDQFRLEYGDERYLLPIELVSDPL